ncbi:MAG: hypothetical protein AB7I18_02235 [Candidatus Berkiella sp.]
MPDRLNPGSVIVDLIQILQNSKPQAAQVASLLSTYKDDAAKLQALQHCLKAWGIGFEGDKNVQVPEPAYYQDLPRESFGTYFNHAIYDKVYALCKMAHQFERNGLRLGSLTFSPMVCY